MSDKPEEPAAPKPEKPAGAKPSKALLAMLFMNLGATGFIAFKIVTTPVAGAAPHEVVVKEAGAEVSGPVTELEPFVVNLDEPTSRYLKISLQLELSNHEAKEKFEKAKQLVRDAILSHLSGLHVKDTLGAEAKDKLRTDLKDKAQKLLGEGSVKRVFFQEFVVQ